METAKIFTNGKSQAVRLPKSCRFSCDEVGVQKIGDIVILFDKATVLDNFLASEPISDDVRDAILEARCEDARFDEQRESL